MEPKQVFPLPLVDYLSFQEIEESRPVLLVTSGIAWQAVKDRLNLTLGASVEVKDATEAAWDEHVVELERLTRSNVSSSLSTRWGAGLLQTRLNTLQQNFTCRWSFYPPRFR